MRKFFFLAAALVACSKAETPATDTTAMAPAPAMAPLTAAELTGKWSGMTMAETSDSVTARWTTESADGVAANLTIDGSKDVIPSTLTYDADSVVGTSNVPYASDPKAPKVFFRSVGRLKDGKLVGTVTNTLASKPDSVVSRGRWEATKAP